MQPELIKEILNTELVATHLGVNIYKDQNNYVCNLWSEEYQENEDVYSYSLDNVKQEINNILAYNYHQSLIVISDHYNQKPDFNNPNENLSNLRDAIEIKINNFTKDL